MPRLTRHLAHWPAGVPHTLELPDRHLFSLLEDSSKAAPDKTALHYYGHTLSYAELYRSSLALAGYLQQHLGVQCGDRVLLLMQTCPHFVIAYYAALRCNATVVAINPMSTGEEIAYYAEDSGARVLITTQELLERAAPLLEQGLLDGCVVGATSEFAGRQEDHPYLEIPDFARAPRQPQALANLHEFRDALAAGIAPTPLRVGANPLAMIAYTSGTTGKPKGAMLSHSNFGYTIGQRVLWLKESTQFNALVVMPLNHLAGMVTMNLALCNGQSIALMSRWNAATALELIERLGINSWGAVTPMLAEMFARPDIDQRDLSSIKRVYCAATAMPEALARRIEERLGVSMIESYGMTESCGGTHVNPPQAARRQCGGIPYINTDARVIDPQSGAELGVNQPGEIVMNGPTVFSGYWNRPEATRESFIEIDGKPFLRSGDIGYYDEDGYFYITDRLKRMINASGHKVWPAEVENALYGHPAVQEACVISAFDPRRGETVKALVVLKASARGTLSGDELSDWARERLSAYKVPRLVEFVDSLPKTATGKTLWRELQTQQDERDRAIRAAAH